MVNINFLYNNNNNNMIGDKIIKDYTLSIGNLVLLKNGADAKSYHGIIVKVGKKNIKFLTHDMNITKLPIDVFLSLTYCIYDMCDKRWVENDVFHFYDVRPSPVDNLRAKIMLKK